MIPGEVVETASTIAAAQLGSGMIPHFPGGNGDPWNHVEAAMALTAAGFIAEAERAYAWLAATQRFDGAWHAAYRGDGSIAEVRLDTNLCAYVATGAWQHYLATADGEFLEWIWPVVEAAVHFVRSRQLSTGEYLWAVAPAGPEVPEDQAEPPEPFALVAASSSIYRSLLATAEIARVARQLGLQQHEPWDHAGVGSDLATAVTSSAMLLREALRSNVDAGEKGAFRPKDEYAMDWYYPVLAGVLERQAARDRLDRAAPLFVVPGWGVRCQWHREWVTAAETGEWAIAEVLAGRPERARLLLEALHRHRSADGSYLTGLVAPDATSFPREETSTYSAAAVVLAHDVLDAGVTLTALGGQAQVGLPLPARQSDKRPPAQVFASAQARQA